jgi:hypothetical protein
MIFEGGYLVWVHLRRDMFPEECNSKLKERGDGYFSVIKYINNDAFFIDIPTPN